ncbi:hypothetical protein WMF38_57605 [Sorangium sp. So ce118]
MGPVYAPGEEDAVNETNYVVSIEDAAVSYVRLSAAAMDASRAVMDAVEAIAFEQRVRLPGSAFVARLFGRLKAWQAARVERQAQAAFARGWV